MTWPWRVELKVSETYRLKRAIVAGWLRRQKLRSWISLWALGSLPVALAMLAGFLRRRRGAPPLDPRVLVLILLAGCIVVPLLHLSLLFVPMECRFYATRCHLRGMHYLRKFRYAELREVRILRRPVEARPALVLQFLTGSDQVAAEMLLADEATANTVATYLASKSVLCRLDSGADSAKGTIPRP